MVYRYSCMAGAAALGLAVFELGRLLRPSVEGAPWQFVVVSGIVLGAVLTWTALTYRVPAWATALINAAAFVVAAVRLVAPDTTVAVFPTASSFRVLGDEVSFALEIIRNGIAPVASVAGLVVIVTAVMWATAAVLVWGLMRGHPYLALVPVLVLSMQLSIIDRSPTGTGFMALFVALLAAVLFAVATDERERNAGRLVTSSGWMPIRTPLPAASGSLLGLAVATTVAVVAAVGHLMPANGLLEWRTSSGLIGDVFGAVTYNPFVDIRAGLVDPTPVEVFRVRLDDPSLAGGLSYRLITLETFDGTRFLADRPELVEPGEVREDPAPASAGPIRNITQDVEIRALQMGWLPAAATPVAVEADASIERLIRVRTDDGSLRLDGATTTRGMRYTVVSEVPVLDLAALATDDDGDLSPAFERAVEAGELSIAPSAGPLGDGPADEERHLGLPDDLDPVIASTARSATAGLATDFEKGLALEAFLRDPAAGFGYTTGVPPGHAAADVAAWLADTADPYYRHGYCEQFAVAMAVMARSIGIPSRVVLGFTPGDLQGGVVVVRDENAHAWVELWMHRQGWVTFDPTPRPDGVDPTFDILGFDPLPYLDAPESDALVGEGAPTPLIGPPDPLEQPERVPGSGGPAGGAAPGPFTRLQVFLAAVVIGVAGLGVVPGAKWWRRRRRMRRLAHGDVTAAWEEIISRLSDLGHRPDPAQTPCEVAAVVDEAMAPLADVYSARIYGPSPSSTPSQVAVAVRAMHQVEAGFTSRYSPVQRLAAWYRPSTLVPLRRRHPATGPR